MPQLFPQRRIWVHLNGIRSSSEEIKKGILDSPDNPFQRVFVVDVEVKTVGDKPALYKVLALKDHFEMP
jgi:hypothetical protein